MELSIGISLAAILVFVAVFFSIRQRHTLAQIHLDPQMSAEDRQYYVTQVRRRLLCSLLLIVLAGMLAGSFFFEKIPEPEVVVEQPLPEETKDYYRLFAGYWILALLILMVIMFIAAFDFIATARFGMRRVRQLENDRRDILEMEAAKLRRRRQELN